MRRGSETAAIDRCVKTLVRRAPLAWLRLLGVEGAAVRMADVSVNLPEHRADQVLFVGEEGERDRWALHVEFQLQPDTRVLPGWFLKNAALTRQLGVPVILAAVYLTRGPPTGVPGLLPRQRGNAGERVPLSCGASVGTCRADPQRGVGRACAAARPV